MVDATRDQLWLSGAANPSNLIKSSLLESTNSYPALRDILDQVFDWRSYLRMYPDVGDAVSKVTDFDITGHYINHGIFEGRSPSLFFDTGYVERYLSKINDVTVARAEVITYFFSLPAAVRFIPNTWFMPWSFRQLYGPMNEELLSLSDYEMFEYYLAHGAEIGYSPNGVFNEEAYRARYPDVAEAIAAGSFRSGFEHFISQGALQGRVNLPGFHPTGKPAWKDEREYLLALHIDLRPVLAWFDEAFYLSAYRDVHALKRRSAIKSGLEHFLVVGYSQGRIPHPGLLDVMTRREASNPWTFVTRIANRGEELGRKIAIEDAARLLRHLLAEGGVEDPKVLQEAIWTSVEPRIVGGTFDEAYYVAANADVAQAVAEGAIENAAAHWQRHGVEEQRIAPRTNVFAGRAVGIQDVLSWKSGVNFFGPVSAASGLGTASRGYAAALRSAGVPVDVYDVSGLIRPDLPLDLFSANELRYSINFFFLNPDQVLPFVARYGTAVFDHRANVGSFVWELASPLPQWRSILAAFDLLVLPSTFCAECVATITDQPIATIPYVISAASLRVAQQRSKDSTSPSLIRVRHEKAAGKRIVLFIMDASSYVMRKGVDVFLELAERYEAAHPGRCLFCLKTHSKDQSNTFTYRIADRSVLLINEVFEYSDLMALKSLADVYISPHRGEGFGLNIFESIILGVPVICSGYGGGIDRLSPDYPYLITGDLRELGKDMGPYRRDAVWFEPDIGSALDKLDEALDLDRQDKAAQRLKRFARYSKAVRAELSPIAVGAQLKQALEQYCALGAEDSDRGLARFEPIARSRKDLCFDLGLPHGARRSPSQLADIVAGSLRPFFSVVTPTYETNPAWLSELYQDLLSQSSVSWEWCIVDDGSQDSDTRAALSELRRMDARIKVKFLPENLGISAATNAAVAIACGRWLVMVDHDDRLAPNLLQTYFERVQQDKSIAILYCDEDKIDAGGLFCQPFCKPDWSPEHLMSTMYVLHCLGIRKRSFLALGGYRTMFDGAQDHDFVLRAGDSGLRIAHVDQVLYHWRMATSSTAATSNAKDYAMEAGRRAISDHLARLGIDGTVEHGSRAGLYRPRPRLALGRVALNILTGCTMDPSATEPCSYAERFTRSILAHECGIDIEIRLVVDEPRVELAAPLARLDPRVTIVPYSWRDPIFNFAHKANFAVATSPSDRVVLLNDDMEALDGGWLGALLEMLELPGVGVAGGRLLYPNGTIQHAGIALGVYGGSAHLFEGMTVDGPGYYQFHHTIRNYSAVTGALIAFRKATFDAVGGFDESFPVDFNDVDFCLRVMELGQRVVFTPHATLLHYESRSARRIVADSLDRARFCRRWETFVRRDPHYNRNLTLDGHMCEPRRPA